jgi:hypothetical protein
MNKLQKLPVLLIAAALLTTPAVSAFGAPPKKSNAAKITMFKCKDEKGRLYYSDKLGPECGQGNVQQLSRNGLTIQPQPAENEAIVKPGERVGTPEQRRRDKALLATYSTDGQIEEAKQRNLTLPSQMLKQAEAKLERGQKELSALHGQADGHATQKKQIPSHLIDDIRAKEALVAKLTADADRKRATVAQIEQRFESDKKRFRELTSQHAAR